MRTSRYFRLPCLIFFALLAVGLLLGALGAAKVQKAPVSDQSQNCIDCHSSETPAMVADWKRSRHARITPADALKKPEDERLVSAKKIPEKLTGVAVSCAECHMLNPEAHKDTFEHNGYKVHLTVTPKDCSTCHPIEASQFKKNLMSHARVNLVDNPVFQTLEKTINGTQLLHDMKTTIAAPNETTTSGSCYWCHGTALEVKGKQTRDTDQGKMEFPVLSGWPNDGVGRFNPDGSKGSCSACHPWHQFSITVARKPYICSQCHKGPDVPADQVYEVSKHHGLFAGLWAEWNFKHVPWTVGKDFTAPTCATCHVSQVMDDQGDLVAKRTHQMNDRLPWRLFGLYYAHPHPKSPNTSIIRNKDGLPLPTTLDGELAKDYLIGPEEQTRRRNTLQKVCRSCHTPDWVAGQWAHLENTIKTSNKMTLTATQVLQKAWDDKVADKSNMFDEAIEKMWIQQWFFYANSTRLASAMMGADYGVFADGRWSMAKNIQDMLDRLKFLLGTKSKGLSAPPK